MIDVNEILNGSNATEVISALKKRTTEIISWETLSTEYEPTKHPILSDTNGRKDKIHKDGTKDKAARLTIGLEKLLTKRMTEFMFAIPVKRTYSGTDTEERAEIAKAIERIYAVAHIDAENRVRGNAYFASCEAVTVWYTKKTNKPHNLYGFPCNYKLKCKTFSPMDDMKLYPLIDEYGEMYAMSYEYRKRVKDEWVTYFETFTEDKHYVWKNGEESDWERVVADESLPIGKIPVAYIHRSKPIWDGLSNLREDIEYTISRNSDVVAYNCAPILKVSGALVGEEAKGETHRIYRVTEGGDVSYVSWAQSIAALQYHVQTLLNLFFMQAQIPDISFENMRSLGNIGYDARRTLLTDAHMKVGDESGAWVEFLEREGSVIKAFLKQMNVGFKEEDVDAVLIEHVITPYVQEDEMLAIQKWRLASNNSPLVSPLDAIKKAALTDDPEQTFNEIMAYSLMVNTAQEGVGDGTEEGGGEE